MTTARDLSARLADLLRREHHALGEFLVALADFDRERRWLELGHASLFNFLHHDLGLSKGAAFYRMTAAHLIQRHQEVLEPLRDGRLCLTTIVELSKVITPENSHEVLPRFFHVSKREAKVVTAELRPNPAVPSRDVVTALRLMPPAPALAPPVSDDARASDLGQAVHPDEPRDPNPPAFAPRLPATSPRAAPVTVEPLTADVSRIHVTVSRRFLKKLDAARDALSHSHPGAGADEILETALDLLLERAAKRKGLVEKPRRETPRSQSDHLPAHVRRAVWKRDGGRCQWPLDRGGVCGSTVRVELDHIVPRAKGGASTIENLRCLCRVHNDLAAREAYGDGLMNRFTRGRRPATATGS